MENTKECIDGLGNALNTLAHVTDEVHFNPDQATIGLGLAKSKITEVKCLLTKAVELGEVGGEGDISATPLTDLATALDKEREYGILASTVETLIEDIQTSDLYEPMSEFYEPLGALAERLSSESTKEEMKVGRLQVQILSLLKKAQSG